jgi:hypothetical protein
VRLRCPTALAALAVVLGTRLASADPAADLEKAHNAYAAHLFDEAESRLRALLDPKAAALGSAPATTLQDPDQIADARMYLGATLVAEKKADEAAAVFAELLSDKPEYQPDPLRVTLDAIDAFTDARAKNRERIAQAIAERVRKAKEEKQRAENERLREQARVAMLEKLAGTEIVTTRNSRLIAAVPFGAGQFQNGQSALGWTFLVSEGLCAAGSGVGAGVWLYNLGQRDQAYTNNQRSVADQYNQRAQTAAVVGDVFAGGFFALALVGVIQAEAAFVPEVTETRKREIPPLQVQPVVGLGGVGLRGSF